MNKTIDYSKISIPDNYRCKDCGARGVRLYREYNTCVDQQTLRCTKCALANQKQEAPDRPSAHSIGWLVSAVPTEDGETFWGYTSVPEAGVEWWNQLPIEAAT